MKRIILLAYFVAGCGQLLAYQPQKITIIGTGYVGLVFGAGLAELGNQVTCADIDTQKIAKLQSAQIPFYEPVLDTLVDSNIVKNRLFFTGNIQESIESADIIFIAVGTPCRKDGMADITYVMNVFNEILKYVKKYTVVCMKSTVPIGTAQRLSELIAQAGMTEMLDIVSNPEFLREGSAVHDFFSPDRIVIGASSSKAASVIRSLYEPLEEKGSLVLETNNTTAETIKYASNVFLAIKVSYINELWQLCDKTGASILDVAKGVGMDSRIGHHFLKPGPGFGGSCLPKDTSALVKQAESYGVSLPVIEAALTTNLNQKIFIVNKLCELLDGDLANKTIGIWGLAFKANTDDVRESPAIDIINFLLDLDCTIQAYDPVAMPNMKRIIPDIDYCQTKEEAISKADALLVLTEWNEFKHFDTQLILNRMRNPIILDARNILAIKHNEKANFKIFCIDPC